MKKALKKMICVFAIVLSFAMFTPRVSAVSINQIVTSASTCAMENEEEVCPRSDTCDSIFGDPGCDKCPAYWMQWILNLMKYIAIIALLVLVVVDFLKAMVQNDKDAIKKAGMNAAKRFIFCVLIFFLPIIVEFIMSLFGAYGTCGIG